jgi:hypothetical protein
MPSKIPPNFSRELMPLPPGYAIEDRPEKMQLPPDAPPSEVALALHLHLKKTARSLSVLDYGCGQGRDVRYYREHFGRADGHDPHSEKYRREPRWTYDVVVLRSVLNTIIKPSDRIAALRSAADCCSPGGRVIVFAPNPKGLADNTSHSTGTFFLHQDGYFSLTERRGKRLVGCFQAGLERKEMNAMLGEVGLVPVKGFDLPWKESMARSKVVCPKHRAQHAARHEGYLRENFVWVEGRKKPA